MSLLANWLLNMAKSWANTRGREPAVIISKNKFQYKFVKPQNTENYSWDNNMWKWGNMFFEGFGNPIRIEYPDSLNPSDYDLIPSKKWKNFMQMDVIKRALSTKGKENDLLMKLVLAELALNILFGVAILAVMGQ